MTEQELMAKIHRELGDVLRHAVRESSVPPAFLAALVANESGGEAHAQRFEPKVFGKVCLAALGVIPFRDPSLCRPIEQMEWLREADHFIGADRLPGESFFLSGLRGIKPMAYSYAWTQLMGWHALEWNVPLEEFRVPDTHFRYALRLLAFFAEKYQLGLASEFTPLFHCWNTGKPDGVTFDPQYVSNGLRRMKIYEDVAAGLSPPKEKP